MEEKYNITYQNIYDIKNITKYMIILFIFLFLIYLITIYYEFN